MERERLTGDWERARTGIENNGVSIDLAYTADIGSVVSMYIGAGVSVTGLVPFRDEDTLGVAFAYAKMSKDLDGMGAFT